MAVLDPFKRFADRVVRPHAFPLYFLLELGYVKRRHRKLVNEFSEGKPYRPLQDLDFSDYKSSDTLFILGSGGSINDLSNTQWDEIERCDSLGFNFWPIHNHIPTYYAFELPHDVRDYRETIYQILAHRASDYEEVPIIVKDLWRTRDELEMDRFPNCLQSNTYISCDMSIPWNPGDRSSFDQSLSYLARLGYFDETNRVGLNFKKRGSLCQHTLMAAMLGYEDIVYLGVDLNDSEYFFLDDQYRDREVPLPTLEHL